MVVYLYQMRPALSRSCGTVTGLLLRRKLTFYICQFCLQVVTNAANVMAGMRVIVATAGAVFRWGLCLALGIIPPTGPRSKQYHPCYQKGKSGAVRRAIKAGSCYRVWLTIQAMPILRSMCVFKQARASQSLEAGAVAHVLLQAALWMLRMQIYVHASKCIPLPCIAGARAGRTRW